jgi:hypothetical protein
VLARDYRLRGWQRSRRLYWRARTARGSTPPAGVYEIAVHFARLDRTTLVPNVSFRLGR